jgi:pyrimidine-nucleoside phosphorylase
MYDIIQKKKDNKELNEYEIAFLIEGFTNGSIPDYQMSAFTMAVYFNGMTKQETAWLTRYMAESGDVVDLSEIEGIKVDKHSTGGVGDKTTLIVAPMVAACGLKVAKMSGRGLGHTGGTVDKLESIPNFKTELSHADFMSVVKQSGIAVVGQSGNLAPADKKLYALRDVTATVDSLPLIASSIMSKKIAAGADIILLDVKTGSGAFMKTQDQAIELAQEMVDIGNHVGRKTAALITNMDRPLGHAIGNALEVIEAIHTLKGNGPDDLLTVCTYLAANILWLAGKGDLDRCITLVTEAVESGRAFGKLCDMVEAQGGDLSVITNPEKFEQATIAFDVISSQAGYIAAMNTESCGITAVMLGAGRETKESPIDHAAGIVLKAKTGDYIDQGDVIATFYTNNQALIQPANDYFLRGLLFSDKKPKQQKLIYGRVTSEGLEPITN